MSRYNGVVWSNGKYIFTGACWQCLTCYTVFITEYDPLKYTVIGRCVTVAYMEAINLNGCVVDIGNAEIPYINTNTLKGVKFTYQ